MPKFDVTYEVWSQEAVEAGDTDERGYEAQGVGLREALDIVRSTRTNQVDGVEDISSSDSRIEHARWFTVNNGAEFLTGERECRSLHIPENVTGASRRRIARLLGIHVPAPEPEFETVGLRM